MSWKKERGEREREKIWDMVAVTGKECLQLIPGLVVADYVRKRFR
jgi:hypothetical protein